MGRADKMKWRASLVEICPAEKGTETHKERISSNTAPSDVTIMTSDHNDKQGNNDNNDDQEEKEKKDHKDNKGTHNGNNIKEN